jgi:hypothetical protein
MQSAKTLWERINSWAEAKRTLIPLVWGVVPEAKAKITETVMAQKKIGSPSF